MPKKKRGRFDVGVDVSLEEEVSFLAEFPCWGGPIYVRYCKKKRGMKRMYIYKLGDKGNLIRKREEAPNQRKHQGGSRQEMEK